LAVNTDDDKRVQPSFNQIWFNTEPLRINSFAESYTPEQAHTGRHLNALNLFLSILPPLYPATVTMTLTTRNRISIAELAVYIPSLLLALFLFLRHGPSRNAAWFFLLLFSLIRICGAALQLDTIREPLSIPINTAALILQNMAISPLMLMTLALMGRVLGGMRRAGRGGEVWLKPLMLRVVQIIVVLGLVLGIVGGVKAGNTFSKTGRFQMQIEGKAGLGLICAGYALLLVVWGTMTYYASRPGYVPDAREKRLVVAVGVSLPFLLVRVVYGCLATFTTDERFNQLLGDAWYFLGMAVIMEMVVTAVCVGVGIPTGKMTWVEQKAVLGEWRGLVVRLFRREERRESQGLSEGHAGGFRRNAHLIEKPAEGSTCPSV
jgi:hypothetical protein